MRACVSFRAAPLPTETSRSNSCRDSGNLMTAAVRMDGPNLKRATARCPEGVAPPLFASRRAAGY